MIKRHVRNENGFTMIEMMVVLIIIAVLIAGGIRFYLGYIENAKITKAKGQIATMQAALDSYYAEKGSYPDTTDELKEAGIIGSGETTTDDPIPTDGTETDLIANFDPWGAAYPYDYSTDAGAKKYCLSTGYVGVKGGTSEVIGQGEDGTSTQPAIATADPAHVLP